MADPYNRSENAMRRHKVIATGGYTGLGKRYEDIECPFCGTVSRAFVWSLCGGGKVCINRKCGAKHRNGGITMPRLGREEGVN
jgi:hypothetical protein